MVSSCARPRPDFFGEPPMRHWIIAILSVFAAGWALQLVADQSPEPFRRRHPVGRVIAAGDWQKPAVIRGRREVAVSRTDRPRLLSPAGHALVGEALAKLILKEGFLKKGLSKK